ncbi:MAG TPA: amidohydrolase family protein [Jatrophihabitans sp.]|nr:amidohydrolase family protein [Jatrophihabitans sp.]
MGGEGSAADGRRHALGRGLSALRRVLATARPARATGEAHPATAGRPGRGALSGRGVAFAGTVWLGGSAEPQPGVLVLDRAGRMVDLRRDRTGLPGDLLVLGGPQHWIVPGLVDAHVHLGFDPAARPDPYGRFAVSGTETGLVAVRDLGAPMRWASRWRTGHRATPPGLPYVAVSGPILTAAGGYPSRSWGADGYAEFVSSPAQARWVVQRLAAEGVDLIKLALEPGWQGWPVPEPRVARAIVDAAHAAGLPVIAHALTVEMVNRALDAGVDELAHTPTERLPATVVERIAERRLRVASTLQTFFANGEGRAAAANAADLVAAGVRLCYGTDLGNAGTRPGVDPRELDRLAAAGLGRLGSLRAATEWSATAAGIRRRSGLLARGRPAELVLLPSSPLVEPGVFRTPTAVYSEGRLTVVGVHDRRHEGQPVSRDSGR